MWTLLVSAISRPRKTYFGAATTAAAAAAAAAAAVAAPIA